MLQAPVQDNFQVCEPLYSLNKESKKKKNVNQGGTSSAKTYTILQVLFMIACEQSGMVITVVGQDVPNLKKGAIRDSAKIVSTSSYIQNHLYDYKNTKGYNKTDRIYEFKNGSIIEFNSYDNEQDARSGKRDYLFVNEANGISYEIYFQLSIRTRVREFLDYNPTAKFWVHEKLIGQPNVNLFISDHRHNSFLSPEQHAEIETIDDPEYWRVYARGMTGAIHGLIYPRFTIIDIMPDIYPSVMGLDFGFNHKSALVDVAYDKVGKRLFWDEIIYQTQLTIGDLIGLMKEVEPPIKKKKIYADHAAADKIEDLRRAGFNITKADKDVKNGIDFCKRSHIYITRRSKGLIMEAGSYKYKVKESATGEPITLDEPVKFKDDGMDAGRYGSYTGFRKPKGTTIYRPNQEDDLDYLLGNEAA